MAAALTQQELDERVAILKRFRTLLEAQRDKFREYLLVLEKQEGKITEDDGDGISAHTDLAVQILKNIAGLQKVIVPMQSMYNAVVPSLSAEDHEDVQHVQADLAKIQQQVLLQNERNQVLLREHIAQIHEQLDLLSKNNPYRGKHSIYTDKIAMGNRIAIEI